MGMAMAYVILLPFAGFDFCVSTKSIIPQLLIIITQHRIISETLVCFIQKQSRNHHPLADSVFYIIDIQLPWPGHLLKKIAKLLSVCIKRQNVTMITSGIMA